MPGRALFGQSYKNEGTMCNVICSVSYDMLQNIIPFHNKCLRLNTHKTDLYTLKTFFNFCPNFIKFSAKCRVLCLELK